MFAYIMLLYLFRELDDPPIFVSLGHLDVGFALFSIFCVVSTVASLGIQLPDSSPEMANYPQDRLGLASWIEVLTTWLVAIFAALLAIGFSMPCLSMRLNEQAFSSMGPSMEQIAKVMIEVFRLSERLSADVSLKNCTFALARWTWFEGEATCIFAFILVLVFAIVLPALHMIMLLVAVSQLGSSGPLLDSKEGLTEQATPQTAVAAATWLNHVAMLDVCIMGVAVMLASSQMYQKEGLTLSFGPGIVALLGAEMVRYTTHFLVLSAAASAVGAGVAAPAGRMLSSGDNVATS
jgi:hypothetical protein